MASSRAAVSRSCPTRHAKLALALRPRGRRRPRYGSAICIECGQRLVVRYGWSGYTIDRSGEHTADKLPERRRRYALSWRKLLELFAR